MLVLYSTLVGIMAEQGSKSDILRIGIVDDKYFLAKSFEQKLMVSPNHFKVSIVSEGHLPILQSLEEGIELDVILMDIQMPIIDGIELTRIISKKYPRIKIIMLTVFDDAESIFNAIRAGASGYLLKDINTEDLTMSLLNFKKNGSVISPAIAYKVLKLVNNPLVEELNKSNDEIPKLTSREVEVLALIQKGLTYKKVSEQLDISEGTVRKHIENVYSKLHAHNKIEAIDKAKQYRIL